MKNRNFIFIGLAVLAVAVIGGGLWAYDFMLGETEAPSGALTAIPIAVNTAAPTEQAATAEAAPQSSGAVIFQIASAQSEVNFSIYEELGGQPVTVVGATDQVAGEIALNLQDLSQTHVGVIQVNARTFATDSDRRNQAIRNFILNTDQYEFITFTPTATTGLSGAAQPGQTLTFQITGDLTIRGVTQPVVFEVTVTGESATRLTGKATTIVKRGDYELTIPSVPNVANVGEEITLEINFVAEA
ncbi:MAG: YceI family protein [Anaerolineales bacterium]